MNDFSICNIKSCYLRGIFVLMCRRVIVLKIGKRVFGVILMMVYVGMLEE